MRSEALALLLVGALALFLLTGDNAMWKRAENADKYLPILNAAEDAYSIPRDLLARMAYQESHFRDDIVNGWIISSAGAVGLMQMLPQFFPVDLTDPVTAANTAAQYLRQLYTQFGSWKLAAAAYNWGPGNLQKYRAGLISSMPTETSNYVSQIFGDLPNGGVYA